MEVMSKKDYKAKDTACISNICGLKTVLMTTVQKLSLYVCSLPTFLPKDSLLGNWQS